MFGTHAPYATDEPGPSVQEIDLPGARPVASLERPDDLPRPDDLEGPIPGMGLAELSALKSRLLLGLVRHLRPQAIVVDHFPFSREPERAGECEAALAYLRNTTPETLRCGGYRGIHAMASGSAIELCQRRLERHIDLLLVYVDPRERDAFFDAHAFLRPFEAKVRFVGYVAPRLDRVDRRASGRSRLLATFGSGLDAYRLIRLVCDAFRLLAATRSDVTLDIVTGASLPDRAFEELVATYDSRRLRIIRLVPALATHLPGYDLVVSMAGYNTCVELYGARTRSIVLPRIPSDRPAEQVEQARKFQGYGAIDQIVDSRTTSPQALAELMAAVLTGSPTARTPLDCAGASATAELLQAELQRRSSVPSSGVVS